MTVFEVVVKSPEDAEIFWNISGRLIEHPKGSSALLPFLNTIKHQLLRLGPSVFVLTFQQNIETWVLQQNLLNLIK